jgi:single-stranded-DNA-specific exonuclease
LLPANAETAVQDYKKEIVRKQDKADAESLPYSMHPVLRDVYAARGITSSAELEKELSSLPTPSALRGADAAAELLQAHLEQGSRMLVVADFDADGATSCALTLRALQAMGAEDVRYLVPNRFEYGYGLTPEIVTEALKQQPGLLITVDNGISSLAGVKAAKQAGVAVLVTDHHLPGEALPEADVIVNPHLHDDGFEGGNLAGVGVIFYVMAALRSRLRREGWFEQRGIAEPNLADLLDLVALGTVADVVPLDHVNRILVHQGLQRIRSGRCRAGIEALLQAARRNGREAVAADMGFAVGPRLNAAGRLDDMSLGIACLLTDNREEAVDAALRLERLNRERREIESEMQTQALGVVEEIIRDRSGTQPFALCLYRPDWHQGVIGILAARLRERFHCPVIAFAPAEPGVVKGSARSISGLHIRDLLDSIAACHPELLDKFGGHAMAAGLSLQENDLEAFREVFDREVRKHVSEEDLRGVIHSDGILGTDDFTLELAQEIRDGGPWGQGFPEPLFDGIFTLVNGRIVGEKHLKMVLTPGKGERFLDAIAFNQREQGLPAAGEQIHVAYRLDVNEYQGRKSLQLIVEYFEIIPS